MNNNVTSVPRGTTFSNPENERTDNTHQGNNSNVPNNITNLFSVNIVQTPQLNSSLSNNQIDLSVSSTGNFNPILPLTSSQTENQNKEDIYSSLYDKENVIFYLKEANELLKNKNNVLVQENLEWKKYGERAKEFNEKLIEKISQSEEINLQSKNFNSKATEDKESLKIINELKFKIKSLKVDNSIIKKLYEQAITNENLKMRKLYVQEIEIINLKSSLEGKKRKSTEYLKSDSDKKLKIESLEEKVDKLINEKEKLDCFLDEQEEQIQSLVDSEMKLKKENSENRKKYKNAALENEELKKEIEELKLERTKNLESNSEKRQKLNTTGENFLNTPPKDPLNFEFSETLSFETLLYVPTNQNIEATINGSPKDPLNFEFFETSPLETFINVPTNQDTDMNIKEIDFENWLFFEEKKLDK